MKFFYIITIIFILDPTYLYSNIFVKEFRIIGNETTQSHIIKREISHPIPGVFDSTLANNDRNKIYNLGLFSKVEIIPTDSIYTIYLIETLKIFPIPLINYEEGKGMSYGAGLAHLNFRGLNEKIILGGMLGKEKIYFLEFYNPWAFGNHGSIRSEIYQFFAKSAVYNYKYQINGFEFGSGFYLNEKNRFNIITGYESFKLSATKIDNNIFMAPPYLSKYKYWKTILKYDYDTRDVYIDPTKGENLSLTLNTKLGLNSIDNRIGINLTFIKFYKINNFLLDPVVSIKSKFIIKYTKNLPIFDNEYLGGEGFVRGYSPVVQKNSQLIQENIEGSQIIYESIQLQHTLINRTDYSKIEGGIDIVYFIDFGITSNHLNSFKLSNTIYGYGVGLRIFLSSIGVISLDLGFNPYGNIFIHPAEGNY